MSAVGNRDLRSRIEEMITLKQRAPQLETNRCFFMDNVLLGTLEEVCRVAEMIRPVCNASQIKPRELLVLCTQPRDAEVISVHVIGSQAAMDKTMRTIECMGIFQQYSWYALALKGEHAPDPLRVRRGFQPIATPATRPRSTPPMFREDVLSPRQE